MARRPGVPKPCFFRCVNDSDLLCRPLSPANRRCHTQRVPDVAGLSLEWSGFGIYDAVEALPRNVGKVSLIFSVYMGLAARNIKILAFPRMGICQARSSFLSLAERKKRSKERAAATLCVRFEIIPSAGSLNLALRASDSQAPDSAEGMISICFADRSLRRIGGVIHSGCLTLQACLWCGEGAASLMPLRLRLKF